MPATPPSDTVTDICASRRRRPMGWDRAVWVDASGLLVVVGLLHLVAFGLLIALVVPLHRRIGNGVFGLGLGLTSYVYGLRHAFDADHIAAIDNTTRKLRGEGRHSTSVGLWFAMGHSTMVGVMVALVAGGARLAMTLTNGESSVDRTLGVVSATVSGAFLYLVAFLNLSALWGLARAFRRMRAGGFDGAEPDGALAARGFVTRILARMNRTVTRPWQMYVVGVLLGLGFDTATEVSLLVLAATGAAQRLPWFAILALPLLFAAGMSLLDSLDGFFMSMAYDWAFLHPARKVYYNLSITGLSVAVALVIGTIEFVGVLHDRAGWRTPLSNWISSIRMGDVGFIIASLFLITWALAVTSWRVLRVEERQAPLTRPDGDGGR